MRFPILSFALLVAALAALPSCSAEADEVPADTAGAGASSELVAGQAGVAGMPSAGAGGVPSAGAGGGAAGEAGAPGTELPPAGFEEDVYWVLNYTCANIICHVPDSPGTPAPRPNLVGDSRDTLYNTLMTYTVPRCGDAPLIVPGDPGASAFMKVVRHECGDLVMPEGCVDNPCITQADLDIMTAWIAAGAPR